MKLQQIEIHNFKGIESVVIENCGTVNALIGKNNSGKSSILHAIDMAGMALSLNNWNQFQPKLQIKDLFNDVGAFSITLVYEDGSEILITSNPGFAPTKQPQPNSDQTFKSILIWPDAGAGMLQRSHRTPRWIIDQVENRNYSQVDSLQILYALKFYAMKNERGLGPIDYQNILSEIKHYFPEIDDVESDRTEQDIATLTYTEYNRKLDILYSGSGLKHFIDILLKTSISRANVILIDEPEMGLHPDLQRRFISYIYQLAEEKNLQVFMATHSQVLLNFADKLNCFRVVNSNGNRKVIHVSADAIHTVISDMGLRPSDVFNHDICIMVEGQTDIVFFEHVIRVLYEDEFDDLAVAVLQYGGSSAEGIISGHIKVSNIVPAQRYVYWIRDRDTKLDDPPSSVATKFKKSLEREGQECHILNKREIEYYFPESLLVAAQQGDIEKEKAVIKILNGDQSQKFREAAEAEGICVPTGKYLRRLLLEYMVEKQSLHDEIRAIVDDVFIVWKREILGEEYARSSEAS